VLREQPKTAIYLNVHGDVVIRQMGGYEDDPYVVIAIHNVPRVARAVLALAGVELPVTSPAANSSGAERSRRYRKRRAQRDDHHATVTHDVTRHTEERDDEPSGAPLLVAAE
jgi:hypothetical protein